MSTPNHSCEKTTDTPLIFNIQDYSTHDGPGIRTVIFFKGCPLRCQWCSNPESQSFLPDIMHIHALCRQCGCCSKQCPTQDIIQVPNNYPQFSRIHCAHCTVKSCESACNMRAIKVIGNNITISDLINRIKTNSLFYRNSNGGITLSGGEPLTHPQFVRTLLAECNKLGISVGLETCGFFDWNNSHDFLTKFDFIYFDIKCLDSIQHKQYTTVDPERIMDNLTNLAQIIPEKLIITVPIIPEVNTTPNFMIDVINLSKKLKITKIRLLRYHEFGKDKYSDLGRKYIFSPTNINIEEVSQIYQQQIMNAGLEYIDG